MRPAIEDGDIVTIEPVADEPVRQGDIILYQSRFDTAVIHRVVRIERTQSERAVITRGDGASQNDMPVPLHRVIGRVKLVERAGERIKMLNPRRSLAQTARAWFNKLKFW